jgi:hypothetical protein
MTMATRVGLVGSWKPLYIAQHREWLKAGVLDRDGWWNRLTADLVAELRSQVERFGAWSFFAYSPLSSGGTGLVEDRLDITDFDYHPEPLVFDHKLAHTGGNRLYGARLTFKIGRIEAIKPTPLQAFGLNDPRTLRTCLPRIEHD